MVAPVKFGSQSVYMPFYMTYPQLGPFKEKPHERLTALTSGMNCVEDALIGALMQINIQISNFLLCTKF